MGVVTYANPIAVGEREVCSVLTIVHACISESTCTCQVENDDTEPRLPPKQRHLECKTCPHSMYS